MCSIWTKPKFGEELAALDGPDRERILKRLVDFAKDANTKKPGALDQPRNSFKGKSPALKGARKLRIGRHRVYYTGSFSECSYCAFYLKAFKKSGVNDEDDPHFQALLKRALNGDILQKIECNP